LHKGTSAGGGQGEWRNSAACRPTAAVALGVVYNCLAYGGDSSALQVAGEAELIYGTAAGWGARWNASVASGAFNRSARLS